MGLSNLQRGQLQDQHERTPTPCGTPIVHVVFQDSGGPEGPQPGYPGGSDLKGDSSEQTCVTPGLCSSTQLLTSFDI